MTSFHIPLPRERPSWKSILLGIASSLLFLLLAARGIDLEQSGALLASTDWTPWGLYVVIACAIQAMRCWRWVIQLERLGVSTPGRAMSIGAIGLTAIFYLPARMGELVRPAMIAADGEVSMSQAMATVVSERLIDGLFVALLLSGAALALLFPGLATALPAQAKQELFLSSALTGGGFLLAILGVWLVAWRPKLLLRPATSLLKRRPALLEKLTDVVTRFAQGFLALSERRVMGRFCLWSCAIWLANALSVALLFQAAHIDLPWVAPFVVIGATALGILIPAGPTSIGPFHFAVVWSLGLFLIAPEPALHMATIFHLAQLLSNLLVGLVGLLGMALFTRGRASDASNTPDDPAP